MFLVVTNQTTKKVISTNLNVFAEDEVEPIALNANVFSKDEVEPIALNGNVFGQDEVESKITNPPVDLNSVFSKDALEPMVEAESVMDLPSEIDPARFVAQQKMRLLQNASSEFGPVNFDRNLLGGDTSFMGNQGFGKNTDAWLTVLQGDTESNRLMLELKKLETEQPNLMGSTEGKALRAEIEERIETALNLDEFSASEIVGQLAEYGQNNPAELAEIILDESIYNPLLMALSVGAYSVGGPVGVGATRLLGLKKVLNAMKLSQNARQRLAAFTAEKVLLRGAGVATVEAGIAAGDEYLRNESVGREPLHNVLTTAEFGAALGFGMNTIGAGISIGRGGLRADKNFADVVMDYQKTTGATESEVIQAFKNDMDKMPTNDDVRAVMDEKLDLIDLTTEAFNPTKKTTLKDKDVKKVSKDLEGTYESNSSTTRPVGTDAKGNIFFNSANIMQDIRSGFNHLFGKTNDGKLGTSTDAAARQSAFNTLNADAFAQFLYYGRNGPERYAQFLLTMEQHRKRLLVDLDLPSYKAESIYRQAAEMAINDMGGDYNLLLKRNMAQRTFDKIKAGITHKDITPNEYFKDPSKMYEPLKDVFLNVKEYIGDTVGGSSEFVRDIVRGPVEGVDKALAYRNRTANLLRDWEGNRMRGELEIDRVQKWVKQEVKDPSRRAAISHYLEGNLDEYNIYLRSNLLDEINLTPREMQVASVARRFMDDVFDMAQKSELLQGFKKNKKQYKKLREKLGMSTELVDNMLIPVKFVKKVGTDGRLAQLTKAGVVQVRQGITKAEIIDYLTNGQGPTARQKNVVQEYMRESYGVDLLDEIAKLSDEDAVRFLVAHEKGHAMQKKKYGKQFNYQGTSGKRGISEKYGMGDLTNKFLTDRAIKLEADANQYALKHMRDSKKLHDEVWDTVKDAVDPSGIAQKFIRSAKLPYRSNYVTHLTSHKVAPTSQDLLDLALDDSHRASQLQTRSRFTKKRKYDTLMDAIYAGEMLYSQDIATLLKTYGSSMVRAQLNSRLTGYLSTMRTLNGHPMMGTKQEVPDYYVKFTHPNFKGADGEYLYVNPNIAPDLRLYFETSTPSLANRILQNIILISKRSALGFSFFHMAALAWSGLNAGLNPIEVFKNVMPGLKGKGLLALAGQEGYDEVLHGIRNGFVVGALEELKGDTLINAMRNIADASEKAINKLTYVKPLGKVVAAPLRVLARSQEIIDTHLWDHVNTGLKASTYLAAINRLIREDARRAIRTGTKETNIDLLRQRAAQFTNDAYGNQNWNQMAMNVRGHMGHRIAAALNKPTTRGYIRMLVFAPDWSLSNLRVITKSLDVTDKGQSEYLKYTIRSALLFAFIAEALQQSAGEGSIFDDSLKDALRPDIGGGQQIELSKQLAEVLRIFIHGPGHVVGHKSGTLVKSLDHTDSISDYLGFIAESSTPIGVRQGFETGNWAGTFGMPMYGK